MTDPIAIWAETEIISALQSELDSRAFSLVALDHDRPPPRGIALVAGAARAERRARQWIKVAVVAILGEGELEMPLEAVADFVGPERARGELAARLRRLLAQDAPGFRSYLVLRAVEFAGDIIELGSTEAVLQYVNPAFEKILGFSAAVAEGKTPAQLVRSGAHPPEFFRELDATLRAGRTWSGRLISRTATGGLVHLESTIAPVRGASGEITHHVAVKRDVTDRVRVEEAREKARYELCRARDAALEASRTKSEFLANMSHELRTPLNAIIGYSELLLEDLPVEGQTQTVEDLRKIHAAGKHLLTLINSVLDMSKIEAGRMEVEFEEVDLTQLAREVRDTLEPLARRAGNQLSLEVSPESVRCTSDPLRLRQVLTNLVGNACKFTEHGAIRIEVARDVPRWSRVSVTDTGIGIPRAQLRRVFRPFVQADSSTTRRYGGTGLGLAISQSLCEVLGGRLEVASEVGKGSTFTVWLPEQNRRSSAGPMSGHGGIHRQVRVLGDGSQLGPQLEREIERLGFAGQVVVASLDEATDGDRPPAALVVEVTWPNLAGWQTLKRLRSEGQWRDVPVLVRVILDGGAVAANLPAADYLLSPVVVPEVLAGVQRVVHEGIAEPRVLIVRDGVGSRAAAWNVLERAGYRVTEATSLDAGLSAESQGLPGAVVYETPLPGAGALAALLEARARGLRGAVPTLVCLASAPEDEETWTSSLALSTLRELGCPAQASVSELAYELGQILAGAQEAPSSEVRRGGVSNSAQSGRAAQRGA